MIIAIFATINRPHAVEIVRQTTVWLLEQGHRVRMEPALAEAINCPPCQAPIDIVVNGAELAIAIGGDGTMLGAARSSAHHNVPVLGVNAGALGFLTELTPEELPQYLPRVLAGEYHTEERMLLRATLHSDGQPPLDLLALNDIVVRECAKGRLIYLDVSVAGRHLGRFGADGLLVASPTGSTAYGLSAGGPIIHPAASVMVLVPICPHSLSFRPIVIPATDEVVILCEGNPHGDDMLVTADGDIPHTVHAGDRIIVQPALERAKFVKLNLFSYYDRLRDKLQWGGR